MSRRGMTLIELLVALVILSAVAAAASSTLREASASARCSAMRRGAAEAIRLCPDLPRALADGALDSEPWPREVETSDGQRWRVGFILPEADAAEPSSLEAAEPAAPLDVLNALVVVERWEGVLGVAGGWREAWRFETPIPAIPPISSSRERRRRAVRAPELAHRPTPPARAMTLIETLAALAILSMLAGVVAVWTGSTLRLQRRLVGAATDELGWAMTALRDDLDAARPSDLGLSIRVAEDYGSIEIVAPPIGAGLGLHANSTPRWKAVRWSVDPARSALVRAELGGTRDAADASWIALGGVAAVRFELAGGEATIGESAPARWALARIEWADAARIPVEFRWETAP